MNIFVLDEQPIHAATMHNNKHVVKMIVETAQLLSTAHRIIDGVETDATYTTRKGKISKKKVWVLPDRRENILYKVTHQNHPCAVWCRESIHNYQWTWNLLMGLCSEYYYRYGQDKGRRHKVEASGLMNQLQWLPTGLDKLERTPFVQCMPDQYKVEGDAVKAYQNYYNGDKQAIMEYKRREKPEWIVTTT